MPRVSGSNIESLNGDLTDEKFVAEVVRKIDYLLLFAGVLSTGPVLARDPLKSVLATLRISVNAIEAAWRAGIRRCVWLSSTCGYPDFNGRLSEHQMFDREPPPQWHALGWMTRYVETLCETVAVRVSPALPMVVLRPSLVYGEYDHFDEATAHFLPSLIRRVVSRERPIEVWGDGTQSRDLIHAADVVSAVVLGLSSKQPYITANIAAGCTYSVSEILVKLLQMDGFEDSKLVYRTEKPQAVISRQFDTRKALDLLQWKPKVTLDDGIGRTLSWYRSMQSLDLNSGA